MDYKAIFMAAATVAIITIPIALAFSSGGQVIGPESKSPDLRGDIQIGEIWKGAPDGNIITINGRYLKIDTSYQADGKVIINGDVPQGAKLNVDGEIVINGDVGPGASINVDVPLVTHNVTTTEAGYCYGYGYTFGINYEGKLESGYKYYYGYHPNCSITRTYIDGLQYDDPDAAIQINGTVSPDVKLETRGGIEISGELVRAPMYVYAPS